MGEAHNLFGSSQYEKYKSFWDKKTKKQVEKELNSWRKYIDKYGHDYSLHGGDMTPPDTLADGDKVLILKEILRVKNE